MEFDNFGKEFTINPADRGFADGAFVRDVERVRIIKGILDWEYQEQLLVTNDICLKSMLHHYGGLGYDHILRNVVPMMEDEGIPREAIDRILRDNPKGVLGS